MDLMDTGMATAIRSALADNGAATVQMNSQFVTPAQDMRTAHARVLDRTATLAFAEAMLYGASGALCTQATGSFKPVRKLLPRKD